MEHWRDTLFEGFRACARVRPTTLRAVQSLSAGDEVGRSRNMLIDGDNLQALSSLYRERGQIDLTLADPPYNTGNDFRYNDRWDKNPTTRRWEISSGQMTRPNT